MYISIFLIEIFVIQFEISAILQLNRRHLQLQITITDMYIGLSVNERLNSKRACHTSDYNITGIKIWTTETGISSLL